MIVLRNSYYSSPYYGGGYSDLEERLYFQSPVSGEYYTAADLKEAANKIKADHSNGTIALGGKKISNPDALRLAYIEKSMEYPNTHHSAELDTKVTELRKKTLDNLKKKKLVGKSAVARGGSFAYEYKKIPLLKRLGRRLFH